jgi:hypothetical protein
MNMVTASSASLEMKERLEGSGYSSWRKEGRILGIKHIRQIKVCLGNKDKGG